MTRLVAALLHVLAGALMLMAPAALNRSPFVFYDTAHYVLLGRSVIKVALHRRQQEAVNAPAARPLAAGVPAAPAGASAQAPPVSAAGDGRAFMLTYVGGRSVYYSTALALAFATGGFWLVAFLQSLLGSWLCWVVKEVLPGFGAAAFYGLVASLTIFSSLPYFATFAMPDVFAGYAVLAIALLLPARSRALRAGLWILIVFGIAAHATNIIVALLASGGVLLTRLRLLGRRDIEPEFSWLGSAVLAGACGSAVFALGTQVLFHDVPHSPPYLTARILADGPGRAFLAHHCDGQDRFAICAYRQLPLTDANEILWSTDPKKGVFNFADYDTRVRLSKEQMRFALAAVLNAPGASLVMMASNAATQLRTLSIGPEIGATRDSYETLLKLVVPDAGPLLARSLSYRGLFPFNVVDRMIAFAFVAGAAFLAARLSRADVRAAARGGGPRAFIPIALIHAAITLAVIILVNGIVCGILSGPTVRYQGRLTWLVVGLAFVTAVCLGPWRTEAPTRQEHRPL